MDIKQNLKAIKSLYLSDAAMSMLCDFERVLDNMDFYTFPNWRIGELVEGPIISRYWVKCTFMWPLDRMPDPAAAKRLLPYGAKITYQKDSVKIPIEIDSNSGVISLKNIIPKTTPRKPAGIIHFIKDRSNFLM